MFIKYEQSFNYEDIMQLISMVVFLKFFHETIKKMNNSNITILNTKNY